MQAEHGLSLYIETQEHRLLFDTGASDLFIRNACLLHIDLQKVDYLILSHGHNDHTGGLRYFLELNTQATVVCKSEIFSPKFKDERENGMMHTPVSYTHLDVYKRQHVLLEEGVTNGSLQDWQLTMEQSIPMAASVATEDTLKFTEFHSMGATYAVYLKAVNQKNQTTKEDRKSTRLNSSHSRASRMPSSA